MPRKSTVEYSKFIQDQFDIYNANETLKDTSKKQTKTALNKIADATRDNFIELSITIADELMENNTSSAHNFISSIKSVITHNEISISKTERKLIDDCFLKIKLVKEKEQNDPQATKKQNERFINLDELKETFIKNKSHLEDDEILAYSLYILMPPVRNDYANMIITNGNAEFKENANYYNIINEQFIFNEYKTAKTDAPLIVKPPQEVIDIINASLEIMPRKNLIYKIGNDNVSTNVFGKFIQSISMKLVGKPIGINDIRHLYASQHNVGNTSIDDLKEDARVMGHSLQIHSQQYTKMYDKMYDKFKNDLTITTDISEIDPSFVKTVKREIKKTKKKINEN
jgi:hypothetical protein